MTGAGPQAHPDDASGNAERHGVGARLAGLHARTFLVGKRRWSVKVWVVSTLVTVVLLGAAFAGTALHYRDTVLSASACPSPARVNALLGTTLDTVSGITFSDLHSCSYGDGADTRAVGIDVALPSHVVRPTGDDACHKSPILRVRGHRAYSVAGTPGTTPGRPSLYVETSTGNWQFTTNLPSLTLARLEALATSLLRTSGTRGGRSSR
ncbi:MAG TPA: hypothetical protein VII76_06300 [Acidimicrobiales bacterium]